MREIKRVKNISLAKTIAVISALVGFIFFILAAISANIDFFSQGNFRSLMSMGALLKFGIGLLLGLAVIIVATILGFILGLLVAFVYNIFSRCFGGLKIELGDKEPPEIKN
jgi:ABC-type multidrug transport system permease subunit